jgi:polyhydroxybutyrate depolymerase
VTSSLRHLALSFAFVGLSTEAVAMPAVEEAEPAKKVRPVDAEKRTIDIDGKTRTYYVHIPADLDLAKPAPLLFVLHGYRGTATGMRKSTGFNDLADRKGFVVVYLQGAKNADGDTAWNTGIAPHIDSKADDVKFVRKVAAEVQSKANINAKRIYATGLSNGGAMTHLLAAKAPDLFAAVGVVAGAIGNYHDGAWDDIPTPKGPVAIAILHGKSDDNVLYNGGPGATPPGLEVRSVSDAIKLWTDANGCFGGHPSTDEGNKGEVVVLETEYYGTCDKGTTVMLYRFTNGEHEWPKLNNASGTDGTKALWKFFAQYKKQ